jgi:putative transposase
VKKSPNINPHAEAWVQRTKHEVLNHFVIFGEKHLRHIVSSCLDYYHRFHLHQGLGNNVLTVPNPPPQSVNIIGLDKIVCSRAAG